MINKVLNLFIKKGGLGEAKKVLGIFESHSGKAYKQIGKAMSLQYNISPTNLKRMAKDRIRLERIQQEAYKYGHATDWHRKAHEMAVNEILKKEYTIGRGISSTYGKKK